MFVEIEMYLYSILVSVQCCMASPNQVISSHVFFALRCGKGRY